jgi:hypothetical protein
MFVADEPEVGGDLDLQFAFRLSQGWDLLVGSDRAVRVE